MLGVTLRPYQDEAVSAVFDWFGREQGNPLVVVPTGGGKSVIMAALIHDILEQHPRERVLIVTHVKELIAQNHAALLRAWPDAPAGMYSAGLRRREHDAQILFAGVQSIVSKIGQIGWTDLVLVDECHRIPDGGTTQYRQVIDQLASMNSKLRVVGFTATPFRTGEGSLFGKGKNKLFGGIAYDCDVASLIQQGYLSKLVSRGGGEANIDLSRVGMRMGEFVESQMEEAAMEGEKVAQAVRQIVVRAEGRAGILVFCCGIAHAHAVTSMLNQCGIESACVIGSTGHDERDEIVARFKARKLRCVVNVNVLTTGFDAPHTDLVVLLRATASPVLYVQMVGRGLRVAEGKADCLVLDFGSNVRRHGPIDCLELDEPRDKEGGDRDKQDRGKECPKCSSIVLVGEQTCETCGYVWPIRHVGEARHEERPDEDRPILAIARPAVERVRVGCQELRMNVGRDGKPNTLRVRYQIGLSDWVSEWVCFDHPAGSFPKVKAAAWWKSGGGLLPAPESVNEAIRRSYELEPVAELVVDRRGEYPRVLGRTFGRQVGADDGQGEAPASDLDYADLPF